MSRDKQIDEMRYLADEMGKAISTELEKRYLAEEQKLEEVLKANGWCKASDLAEEIFAEIDKIIDKHYNRHIFGVEDLSDVEQEAVMNFSGDVTYDIAELKKKYKEGSNGS